MKNTIKGNNLRKVFFVLQLGIVLLMMIYFILQILFVPDGPIVLIVVVPFYLLYIVSSTKFTIFSKKTRNFVSFVILHVTLLTVFFAAIFIHAMGHGGALISISIKTLPFIITSYIVVAIITSILSLINILLSFKKENKSN